ncbi:MAG: AAA family ATPase [Thermoflavifilum sp.]|nr:AAA family ATPase [Thermoflavifilum sp.]
MRIKKISKIENLGLYKNFEWDNSCSEFKQFNFFYGWNYSGKTSLSRLFRCIEERNLHKDYPGTKFCLETENGNISESNIDQEVPICVFNEDFVEENFKWNDENHRINPVLIMGKESIGLQEELKKKEEEKQKIEEEKTNIERELKEKSTQLENNLTNKASEIRRILGITNPRKFDKNNLKEKIEELSANISNYILSGDEESKNLRLYRDQTSYQSINTLSIELKAQSLYQKVKNICEKKISAQQIIEKLKSNPELNQWVRKGLDLHKNEEYCQFCGNKLPEDLFDKLNKHFSEEYDKLMQDLKSIEQEINNHNNSISKIQFPDKARFYPDYSKEYEQKKEELKSKLEGNYIKLLDTLITKIEEKKNKPFDILIIDLPVTKLENQINQYINDVNTIIDNNNAKINQLENQKKDTKLKLINHYSAKAIDEIKYYELNNQIKELIKQKEEKEKEFGNIVETINSINSKIKQANIGAEKVNKYLKQFFRDDQIKLNSFDDGTYQVNRAGIVAKNLSTGEKNIISLIYFMTKLEENNFDKSKAIIFIDDPVSSLDSNHIFHVYGFLSEKLKDCGQVFITTHNFDFFNLLKDMVKGDPDGTTNRRSKKDKENFYLIKKIKSNDDKISTITELPKVLRNFKSEYNYLFSELKKFNDSNDKNNFELLYILPNIARRFLESYLFVKYPDGSKFKDKADKFFKGFTEASEKQTTLKILDEYSHEENPEHIQKFPDIHEIEIAIKTVLSVLEKKDKEHYEALCESIK